MKQVCPEHPKFMASFKQLPNIQPQVKSTIFRSCSLFVVCISDVTTDWLVALCFISDKCVIFLFNYLVMGLLQAALRM